jgi:ABC-type transport system substrate-binding protein
MTAFILKEDKTMKKGVWVTQLLVLFIFIMGIISPDLNLVYAKDAVVVPTPIAPTGTITDDTPTYKWTVIANATKYGFQVYKGTTLIYTKTKLASACGTTYCTLTPTEVLTLGDYKWRVRAYVSGVWKSYSSYLNFSVVSPIPVLVSPKGSITDDTPTYKWKKVVGATKYIYEVYKGTTKVLSKTVYASTCGITYCMNTPTNVLTASAYKWRAKAYVGGIWSAFSPYKYFTVTTTVPQLTLPSGETKDLTPTYQWVVVPDATQYEIAVFQGDDQIFSQEISTDYCDETSCSFDSAEIGAVLWLGDFTWKARVMIGTNWGEYSALKAFNVVNPYVGSGLLDGEGIPSDFFTDVHIRKAFSYCFDWDTYIEDVYGGNAQQSLELPMPGMTGYEDDAPHYTLDLVQAEAEFKLADLDHDGIPAGTDPEGDIWTLGFKGNGLYNEGNTTRQKIVEILQANLASINEKFVLEPKSAVWPEYSSAQRSGLVPVWIGGWMEDFHDAHNWYVPYTIGTYASRQRMPEDLKSSFQALVEAGVIEKDTSARAAIYHDLNQMYYDQVPGIPMVLTGTHIFEQRWITSRVKNPLFSGIYYYSVTKDTTAPDPDSVLYAGIGEPTTLDPALAYDTSSGNAIRNIYETLVFYEGEKTDTFDSQLAESWDVSLDGTVWTFHIRDGVTFHAGGELTPSDVAYSFQRGLLQGGSSSPEWLLAEPILGIGNQDITYIIDGGASMDDRAGLIANNTPEALEAACQTVKDAITFDDTAGTVTMTLAQSWGPFLATIANTWGSIMDQEWVADQGGWNGSCSTWQNYYAMGADEDPFSTIANGTGPYKLSSWTRGDEMVLTANDSYWRTTPAYSGGPSGIPSISTVTLKVIFDAQERYDMMADGSADFADNPGADDLVGEVCNWDSDTGAYAACQVVNDALPLRLWHGKPNFIVQDVLLYTFDIQ